MEVPEVKNRLEEITKIILRIGVGIISIAASIGIVLFNETRQDVKSLLINQARYEERMINQASEFTRHDFEIKRLQDRMDKLQ